MMDLSCLASGNTTRAEHANRAPFNNDAAPWAPVAGCYVERPLASLPTKTTSTAAYAAVATKHSVLEAPVIKTNIMLNMIVNATMVPSRATVLGTKYSMSALSEMLNDAPTALMAFTTLAKWASEYS